MSFNILFQMELNFHNINFKKKFFHSFIVIGNAQQFESSSLVSLGNGHGEEDMGQAIGGHDSGV